MKIENKQDPFAHQFKTFAYPGRNYVSRPFSMGLTKLEWFAGMALIGRSPGYSQDKVVKACFDLAEAMLKESQKREKENGNRTS